MILRLDQIQKRSGSDAPYIVKTKEARITLVAIQMSAIMDITYWIRTVREYRAVILFKLAMIFFQLDHLALEAGVGCFALYAEKKPLGLFHRYDICNTLIKHRQKFYDL